MIEYKDNEFKSALVEIQDLKRQLMDYQMDAEYYRQCAFNGTIPDQKGRPSIVNNSEDYRAAGRLDLINVDRTTDDIEHHSSSIRLVEFLAVHDFLDHDNFFMWGFGTDSTANGDQLMCELDSFFDTIDITGKFLGRG